METPKDEIVSEIRQSTRSKLHLLAYAACQFKPTFKEHLDPVLRPIQQRDRHQVE